MKPALELTSVPIWAASVTQPAADLSGRFWTVIAVGDAGARVARLWSAEIAAIGSESRMSVHALPDDGDVGKASTVVRAAVDEARVGWRLMIAGPAASCLKLRAEAVAAGVADDELTVASTDVGMRSVQCVHCRSVTTAVVALEDTLVCSGCSRNLLVYYHVSRRQGAHLGFMVDAEAQVRA